MKTFLLLLSCAYLLTSCEYRQPQKVKEQPKSLLVKTYLDRFLVNNTNCFNNDITEKEGSKKLSLDFMKDQLGDSIRCISELPMEFERLMEYNENKYVVKFSFSETFSKCEISDAYDVTFQTFSIVNKETVLKLKQGSLYNIFGSCHDYANQKSFTLPSGHHFDGYPRIYALPSEGIKIDLGTLIVENLSFTEIKK